MHAVAASFSSLLAAQAARAALVIAFPGRLGSLRVAPLGHATYPVIPQHVLAGDFDDADLAAARRIVEEYGGSVVADVDRTLL